MNHKYGSFLDLDPRIQVDISLNAYFRSLKKVVNPSGKDLSVIYGCSGGDCSTVLLATDAKDLTFVDLTKISFTNFTTALTKLKAKDALSKTQIKEQLEAENYFSFRSRWMGAISGFSTESGHSMMPNLELKLLYDLRELGTDLSKVIFTSIEKGVQIDFQW